MMIPLKSIYAFVKVAETGSMGDAASQLFVSHSAISQSIKTLEGQLEQPLFTRVGRRVELNQAGTKYYNRISPAIKEIISASEEIKSTQRDNDYITLNMVNSMVLHWWIPKVDSFQKQLPDIDIRISNLVNQLDFEKNNIDAAIIQGSCLGNDQYHCEKLADDELILVASPNLLSDDDINTQDLQNLLVQYPAIIIDNPRRENDWQIWCKALGLNKPTTSSNLTFSSSMQATQAAILQSGLLVTHKQYVNEDIKAGMLIQIGQAVLNPLQEFYFVTPSFNIHDPRIINLRDWLKVEFDKYGSHL